MLADWQRDQAEKCSCRGTDELCPCQNTIGADWLFGRLRIETVLNDEHAAIVAKVLAESGQGMEAIAGRSQADIMSLAAALRRIKIQDDAVRATQDDARRRQIFAALCAEIVMPGSGTHLITAPPRDRA
jgi:hypothetical protein